MSPCSRHPREYGLKLLFLKTEVEKSGRLHITSQTPHRKREDGEDMIEVLNLA